MLLLNSFLGRHEDIIAAHYADHYALSLSFYTENESFVDLAHQSGKKVYVWTVNTQTDLEKVVDSDIDGIITDQPVLAREIANAKNAPDFLVELIKRFFKKNEQGLN
jgi:glycerophosphoryl diester phosphodiesterase